MFLNLIKTASRDWHILTFDTLTPKPQIVVQVEVLQLQWHQDSFPDLSPSCLHELRTWWHNLNQGQRFTLHHLAVILYTVVTHSLQPCWCFGWLGGEVAQFFTTQVDSGCQIVQPGCPSWSNYLVIFHQRIHQCPFLTPQMTTNTFIWHLPVTNVPVSCCNVLYDISIAGLTFVWVSNVIA